MYSELLRLITTDAVSGRETGIADYLAGALENLGFTVVRDDAGKTFGGECGNVCAWLDGMLDGALLLSAHMDRVPNGVGIHPVERDGILYSDGSTILAADDLSGVCAVLEGLRQVLAAGRVLPRLEVCFTVGEELGLMGAKAADRSLFKAKQGYIFDAPGPVGRIVHAAPGRCVLDVEVTGQAAHAGVEPEKGINAARILCEMVATLRQGRLNSATTANFPILSTGTKVVNVVCDFASFRGEVRSSDARQLEEYVLYLQEHCRRIASENKAGVEIRREDSFRAFSIPKTEAVLQNAVSACEALGIPCFVEAGGGGIDANVFNESGMTCVGVATGYSRNHTFAEQLVLDDFFKAGDLARELIFHFARSLKPR